MCPVRNATRRQITSRSSVVRSVTRAPKPTANTVAVRDMSTNRTRAIRATQRGEAANGVSTRNYDRAAPLSRYATGRWNARVTVTVHRVWSFNRVRRMSLVVVATCACAFVAAQASAQSASAAAPRPWSRISFFTNSSHTTTTDGTGGGFGEFTTAFSYQLPDVDERRADYGVGLR